MMDVGAAAADRLTLWKFTAMKSVWNERQKPPAEQGSDVEAPSPERVRRNFEKTAVH